MRTIAWFQRRWIVAWWAFVSAAIAPVALVGGWSVAASRQTGYEAAEETISALAQRGATDRWVMTAALVVVGVCHIVTALGLFGAHAAGRLVLGTGGVSTLLVAAFPLPATGSSAVHTVAASVAFLALAIWPSFGTIHRSDPARQRGRMRAPRWWHAGTVVLVGLTGWFAWALFSDVAVGTAERYAAGGQALFPLIGALSLLPGSQTATS